MEKRENIIKKYKIRRILIKTLLIIFIIIDIIITLFYIIELIKLRGWGYNCLDSI